LAKQLGVNVTQPRQLLALAESYITENCLTGSADPESTDSESEPEWEVRNIIDKKVENGESHHTIVPPSVATAKEQEGNLELDGEDNAGTTGVECAASDRCSESSDDSNDEEYVEEPRRLRKRKRVRFSKTVKYAPDGPKETLMSPADTLDNESQGGLSDVAYASEEIPVSGLLTLKVVDGRMQYNLTFSQDLLLRFLGQKQSERSNASRSTCSNGSTSSLVERRGVGRRGRYRFKKEDDDKIIQMREKGKSWDEIAEEISGSTKGSIQVHYSTKLKDRIMGTPKRVSKRRRVE
jgi:hypothetical protein